MIGFGFFKEKQTLDIQIHRQLVVDGLDEVSVWCVYSKAALVQNLFRTLHLAFRMFWSRCSAKTIDRPVGIILLIKPCQDA